MNLLQIFVNNIIMSNILLLLLLIGDWSIGAHAVDCPSNCKCAWVLDSLEVDCSLSGLTEYPNFYNMPIEHLDLSKNFFVEFPKHLEDVESLIYLDLSNNQIEYLDENALLGFGSLRTLLLANNSFTNWLNLNPNEAFGKTASLKRLSLSGNILKSFTDEDAKQMLISESLSNVELDNCGITTVGGDILINGLPNLERLVLSNNPIASLKALPSTGLRVLELTNCNIQRINNVLLAGFPNLEAINLSWNTALQLGSKEATVESNSLTELDISFCNLDDIDLSGFPSLAILRARGNMLHSIDANTLVNNTHVELIDFSRNSIRSVELDAFTKLNRLTKIDLAYNEIARLDRNVFRANEVLVSINLSHNIFEKFTKFISNSLRDINLNGCGIWSVDATAFTGLSSIQRLDLSNNLLKDFPSGMRSETLQKLDLSNCRLSIINNNTFRDFPELASLHLNGNRLTNPFPRDYFKSNKFLDEIWIGDNPWICNCFDPVFMEFYDFLTAKPPKLKDKSAVRCASPADSYGKTWEIACAGIWVTHGYNGRSGEGQKTWSTIMLCILVIAVLVFFFICLNKIMSGRKRRSNEREYRENQEEMREIRRLNQRMLDQTDGGTNAPDAYLSSLPSYDDALSMPKPVRPVKSMLDITASFRGRKRLQRAGTDPTEECIEEEYDDFSDILVDHRTRFRSEEMLSNRDKERTAQIAAVRRTGRIDTNNSGSRLLSAEDSRFPAAHLKSQNLQSAEHIGNFQSYENSPYSKRRPKIAEIPPFKRATFRSDSVEFLTDPEYDANSKPASPFAKRKPKAPIPIPQNVVAAYNCENDQLLPPAIENYYAKADDSNSSGEFQILVEPQIHAYSSSDDSMTVDIESGRRKVRKNSSSRRVSGNFTAAAAAAATNASSSSSLDKDPIVVVHKPMKETLF